MSEELYLDYEDIRFNCDAILVMYNSQEQIGLSNM